MNECNILRGVAEVTGGNMTITLPNVGTLVNGDIGKFVIVNGIDYTNPLGTVSVVINGTTFPLKTKYSNNVRIEQLKSRKVYTIALGAETPNFTVLNCLPASTFAFPTYSATTTEAGA